MGQKNLADPLSRLSQKEKVYGSVKADRVERQIYQIAEMATPVAMKEASQQDSE